MAAHPIVFVDISANNLGQSANFYREAFGWNIQDDTSPTSRMFQAEGGLFGFLVQAGSDVYKAGDVLMYLGTDDLDSSLAKVVRLGGQIVLPKTEVAGYGWYAFFTDLTGNRLGLFQALTAES
jgi:predicted enzyme related to lactoylglutathione lyase